jgi:hypothetical protein
MPVLLLEKITIFIYKVVRVSNVCAVVQLADGHIDPGTVGHGHVGKQKPENKITQIQNGM